jgi:hypothetical protein
VAGAEIEDFFPNRRIGEAARTAALEKANADLKASQANLQRRWQYLAEAQRLSQSALSEGRYTAVNSFGMTKPAKLGVSHDK